MRIRNFKKVSENYPDIKHCAYFIITGPKFKYILVGWSLDLDPDPHWENGSGSGSRRAKMIHKSEGHSSFFQMPDVPFGGIKTSPVA
jgi:hypothetical protein